MWSQIDDTLDSAPSTVPTVLTGQPTYDRGRVCVRCVSSLGPQDPSPGSPRVATRCCQVQGWRSLLECYASNLNKPLALRHEFRFRVTWPSAGPASSNFASRSQIDSQSLTRKPRASISMTWRLCRHIIHAQHPQAVRSSLAPDSFSSAGPTGTDATPNF